MFLKRILPISIILLSGLAALFCYHQLPCFGDVTETHQNSWQDIYQVKVERKPEACGFGPTAGNYYIFSSRQANSENWHEIMTVNHDDPIDIPNKAIRIVDEKTAFVFVNNKLAVTNDSGKNWNIWDAVKLPNWNFPDFSYIHDVEITSDGKGKLDLTPLSTKNTSILQFETNDFGKSWTQTK